MLFLVFNRIKFQNRLQNYNKIFNYATFLHFFINFIAKIFAYVKNYPYLCNEKNHN